MAVVGSGPAGLAAAQQLTRAGHGVTVFERADRIGGLLRYGIPEFKMEKRLLDRRLEQMASRGHRVPRPASTSASTSPRTTSASEFDAIVLAGGATASRDLPIPGRELDGIHQAMEFLPVANRVQEGDLDEPRPSRAEGKHVVIIGGGDTGADCLGTAHRQGAASVHQFEIMPRPPDDRPDENPWPTWPVTYRTSSAHEEGGERVYASTPPNSSIDGDGSVRSLQVARGRDGGRGRPAAVRADRGQRTRASRAISCCWPWASPAPRPAGSSTSSASSSTDAATSRRDDGWRTTVDDVFVCGDMGRGQSLIVWAIAEGRSAAAAVDRHLMGTTDLPSPITPSAAPLR